MKVRPQPGSSERYMYPFSVSHFAIHSRKALRSGKEFPCYSRLRPPNVTTLWDYGRKSLVLASHAEKRKKKKHEVITWKGTRYELWFPSHVSHIPCLITVHVDGETWPLAIFSPFHQIGLERVRTTTWYLAEWRAVPRANPARVGQGQG